MTTKLYKRICAYLHDLIAGTEWEGHVFTVGGCCRDMIMNNEITDVDLAIDLPMGGIRFAEWLHKKRLTLWQPVKFERYGTAMLRLRAFPHDDIEMVQTRAEKYTDRNSRNPETAFGSLRDDCFRRDLTINALYYDISNNKIIDLTGRGLDDIRNHVICTPSEPDSTFDDDPIRILRAIRFATRLGWKLPTDIFQSMKRNVSRLTIIKPERMRGEFEKILLRNNAGDALNILTECGAMRYILPQLHILKRAVIGKHNLWEHTLRTVNGIKEPSLLLRMSALLHGLGMLSRYKENTSGLKRMNDKLCKALIIQALCGMKYHNPFVKEVLFMIRHCLDTRLWGPRAENMQDSDLRKLEYECGKPERLNSLLQLVDAVNQSGLDGINYPEQVIEIRKRMQVLSANGTEMYSYHLPFAERRIKKLLHIAPGPLVDDTLNYMMTIAFINPKRTKSEFERLVSSYTPQAPDTPSANDDKDAFRNAALSTDNSGKQHRREYWQRRHGRKNRKTPNKESHSEK